jgi:hypothetical protein
MLNLCHGIVEFGFPLNAKHNWLLPEVTEHKKAGCQSLFEIDESVCVQWVGDPSLAGLIEKYLNREQSISFKGD